MNNIQNTILEITKSSEYIDYNKLHEGNVFSITRTARLENMHSNFIAWLLDSQSHHGLGDYPIKLFLAILYMCKYRSNNENARWSSELDDVLPVVQFDPNYSIICKAEREVTFKITKKRSIDILLIVSIDSKKLPIIIENKVDSSEHDEQTEDYFNWGENEYKDSTMYYQPLYVYLTPKYNQSTPKNINFIQMKYQDLLDYVLEPSLCKSSCEESKNNISAYIRCLSYQTDNEKGENIMAITKEERNILETFYEKNKNLMNAIIEMMMDDDDVDPKLKAGMSGLLVTRDYSKYKFNGQLYKKNQLVLAVVKQYVNDKNPTDFNAIQSAFPKDIQGSFGVVKDKLTQKEISGRRFYFNDPIPLADGTEFYVCTQWGKDNILDFINKAQQYGYVIEKA